MFQKILVGYDGSEPADKAIALALDLAERCHAAIRVLSVARPPEFGEEVETEAVLEHSRKHYHEVHKPLRQLAADRGIDLDCAVAVGHPAERILIESERWGADLHLGASAVDLQYFHRNSQAHGAHLPLCFLSPLLLNPCLFRVNEHFPHPLDTSRPAA